MKVYKKILKICLIVSLFQCLFLSLHQVKAEGLGGKTGAATTLSPFPLWGPYFGLVYREALGDEIFSDFQIDQYYLSGKSNFNNAEEDENTSTADISLNAQLLSAYLLFKGEYFFWGPGIGYGLVTINEDHSSSDRKDPTPFFTKKDIHFGTLMMKVGKTFELMDCEVRFNSFGGLISLEGACGIFF